MLRHFFTFILSMGFLFDYLTYNHELDKVETAFLGNRPRVHPNVMSPYIKGSISKYEIRRYFPQCKPNFGDEVYWKPSREWVLNNVAPAYSKFLDAQQIQYSDKFDCDDFARTFCTFAHLCYYSSTPDRCEEDAAIGEIYYHPDTMEGEDFVNHSINVIVLDDGELMFFEPQTGEEVFLTNTEITSIFFVSF